MYSLIEFPENNGQEAEVEVVPDIWLEQKNEKWYCFWPRTTSTKQIRKAIEKRYLPEKNWTSYNCRLLHTYGKFRFALENNFSLSKRLNFYENFICEFIIYEKCIILLPKYIYY